MRLLLAAALFLCASAAAASKPPLDTLGIPPQGSPGSADACSAAFSLLSL
jgi:hypothetical protein